MTRKMTITDDEVEEEEEKPKPKRGRKRKSEECGQPKKAKSAGPRAKGKQKAKGSEEDEEDEDYGRVEVEEEADTRPAKKARSPAKPKATTKKGAAATPANPQPGAKPTTSEDFFKRKDFVNHYYSAVWTLEKKAKDSKEKTTITEEGSSATVHHS